MTSRGIDLSKPYYHLPFSAYVMLNLKQPSHKKDRMNKAELGSLVISNQLADYHELLSKRALYWGSLLFQMCQAD
jgi:hypothetical protein